MTAAIDRILVDHVPGETRAAIMAGGRLVDLHIRRGDPAHGPGAIHLGRVAQVVAGFDGAFVDIGLEQAAFLRLSDAAQPPAPGDLLVVQVVRAAGGEMGLGVTARPRLAGRLLDWTPGRPGLRPARGAPLPPGVALADGEGAELKCQAEAEAVAAEIAALRAEWAALLQRAGAASAPAPLAPPPEPWVAALLAAGADVRFADRRSWQAATALVRQRWPDLAQRLVLDPAGWRLFDEAGVEEQIAAALARRVPLPGGGELVIDEVEAATLVDVDAGPSRAAPGAINRKAVPALAAQLRLRAIGGQILVDFVREGGAKSREALAAALRAAVTGDPDPVEIAGWSRLGLLEMTRRRSRPSLASLLSAPSRAEPSSLARGYDALRAAARAAAGPAVAAVVVAAGREVETVLRGPLAADLSRLAEQAGVAIRVEPAPALGDRDFHATAGRP
ncbi:ribonuclease E/G [Stella sp.]|uniref:ribonuclease E/G n=1 Tax=Stella sp. TaxID=2912054 RepID=UPI0035B19515